MWDSPYHGYGVYMYIPPYVRARHIISFSLLVVRRSSFVCFSGFSALRFTSLWPLPGLCAWARIGSRYSWISIAVSLARRPCSPRALLSLTGPAQRSLVRLYNSIFLPLSLYSHHRIIVVGPLRLGIRTYVCLFLWYRTADSGQPDNRQKDRQIGFDKRHHTIL